MPIEVESPEEYGYDKIRYNLSESSIADQKLSDLKVTFPDLTLLYGEHRGNGALRELIAAGGHGLTADDVLMTTGAAGALFIISKALRGRGPTATRGSRLPAQSVRGPLRHLVAYGSTNKYRPVNRSTASGGSGK